MVARVNNLASVLHSPCFFMQAYVYAELRNQMGVPRTSTKVEIPANRSLHLLDRRAELENVSQFMSLVGWMRRAYSVPGIKTFLLQFSIYYQESAPRRGLSKRLICFLSQTCYSSLQFRRKVSQLRDNVVVASQRRCNTALRQCYREVCLFRALSLSSRTV